MNPVERRLDRFGLQNQLLSVEDLIQKHSRLMYFTAEKFRVEGVDSGDVVQEALLSLLKGDRETLLKSFSEETLVSYILLHRTKRRILPEPEAGEVFPGGTPPGRTGAGRAPGSPFLGLTIGTPYGSGLHSGCSSRKRPASSDIQISSGLFQ